MPDPYAARRKAILDRVHAAPGANLRQLQRYTGIPLSTASRLLNELEWTGKIESESDTHYRRFFPAGKRIAKRERTVLGHVSKKRPRRILETLLANPGLRHGDLAAKVNLPAPTLTYYMKQIVGDDLVKVRKMGAARLYRVKQPAVVKKALERTKGGYQESRA